MASIGVLLNVTALSKPKAGSFTKVKLGPKLGRDLVQLKK